MTAVYAKMAVIGCGLIGSSIVRAAREAGAASEIVIAETVALAQNEETLEAYVHHTHYKAVQRVLKLSAPEAAAKAAQMRDQTSFWSRDRSNFGRPLEIPVPVPVTRDF